LGSFRQTEPLIAVWEFERDGEVVRVDHDATLGVD